MMNLNECSYSEGGKHTVCNHQQYCIFNGNRWKLEKKITQLQNELEELKKIKNSYILGYTCNMEYDIIIKKIKITRQSIARLTNFKQKIIDGEINGYGILESDTISSKTGTD